MRPSTFAALLAVLLFACGTTTPPPPAPEEPACLPDDADCLGSSANIERRRISACVDTWLWLRALDRYGSPLGTGYPGGNPLCDFTGQCVDRIAYVCSGHPELQERCGCTPL